LSATAIRRRSLQPLGAKMKQKYLNQITFFICLLLSFNCYSDSEQLFPIVETKEFSGVVVPTTYTSSKYHVKGDKNGYWEPNTVDILKFEKRLEFFLHYLSENLNSIPRSMNIDYSLSSKQMAEKYNKFIEAKSMIPMFLDDESLNFIIKNLKKYKRQYIGFTQNKEKRIYCNFFTPMPQAQLVHHEKAMGVRKGEGKFLWRKGMSGGLYIDGGGANYWTIVYCMKQDKCIDMKVNAPE